jgi:hypothetical protein
MLCEDVASCMAVGVSASSDIPHRGPEGYLALLLVKKIWEDLSARMGGDLSGDLCRGQRISEEARLRNSGRLRRLRVGFFNNVDLALDILAIWLHSCLLILHLV